MPVFGQVAPLGFQCAKDASPVRVVVHQAGEYGDRALNAYRVLGVEEPDLQVPAAWTHRWKQRAHMRRRSVQEPRRSSREGGVRADRIAAKHTVVEAGARRIDV